MIVEARLNFGFVEGRLQKTPIEGNILADHNSPSRFLGQRLERRRQIQSEEPVGGVVAVYSKGLGLGGLETGRFNFPTEFLQHLQLRPSSGARQWSGYDVADFNNLLPRRFQGSRLQVNKSQGVFFHPNYFK